MAEKFVINTIMEGANHDSPSALKYNVWPFHVHENARAFTYQ